MGIQASTRWSGAGLLVIIAILHIVAFPAHVKEAEYIGALFLLYVGAAFVLAAGILRSVPGSWATAALLTAIAIALYVLARVVGLPEYREDGWVDSIGGFPIGLLSFVLEVALLAIYVTRKRATPLTSAPAR